MTTAVIDEIELTELKKGGPPPSEGGPGGGEGRGPEAPGNARGIYITGIYLALVTITMFFMALSSAYIVRKGIGSDWQALAPPQILWLNTALLIISSVTLEAARRRLSRGDLAGFRNWWGFTTTLGLLFLGGQIIAWRQLAEAGIFLDTNPSSAFFYVFTATHGAHLLFGVAFLAAVALRRWQPKPNFAHSGLTRSIAADVAGVYWHFMDGLWVFLFLLLTFGR